MKTNFLALCLFLFAYKATSSVIVDTNNNPVMNSGGAYYLVPVSNEMSVFVSSSSDLGGWDVSQEFPIGYTVRVSESKSLFGPFKVERAERGYKIMYYPDRGETGGDIGLVHRDGKYRLAVKDGEPFMFHIKKATDDKISAGIMSIV
ncbi:hypothetical protein L6164_037114 [Bauhinia variegata]|uniref:Uncharacterized protein n=1 Tax=Bauhinia variegata TaxID=167791 RepID=A0ACB9KJ68_BAUVA|nr:hypothetical protein L6164_037114 [Bauhinia variegata]